MVICLPPVLLLTFYRVLSTPAKCGLLVLSDCNNSRDAQPEHFHSILDRRLVTSSCIYAALSSFCMLNDSHYIWLQVPDNSVCELAPLQSLWKRYEVSVIPRPFLSHSKTIPITFQDYSYHIPRLFLSHSKTIPITFQGYSYHIPRLFLSHSKTIPITFQDYSLCFVPRGEEDTTLTCYSSV